MINKGQKIDGRYEIIKSIGEGGMANVYLAYDQILNREVAVKVLRGDLSGDEKFVKRFQREALAASSLSHPNIIEVYDVGEENGKYYIVMEYLEGKNLKSVVKRRKGLSLPEVIDIMLQLTDSLAIAHENYIIHRDIKPQNIIMLDNGLAKLTDFGIALALNTVGLTQTNSVMGTVHYLPPEQASGKGSTTKSDIYSLGILMYELITGKVPFKGETAVEIALKHLKDEMPSVIDEDETIPQSVENIIIKATAKNPKNRYANMKDMHNDLSTCLLETRKDEDKIKYAYVENTGTLGKNNLKSINKKSDEEKKVATKIESHDEKTNPWVLYGVIAFCLILLVGILFLIFSIIPNMNRVEDVKIPDLTDKTEEEALTILKDLGINVDIVSSNSEEVLEGIVIDTKPNFGSMVKEGAVIKVYISSGSNKIIIEDYTGYNVYEVKGSLETRGLNVIIEKKEISKDDTRDYDKDEIVGQSKEVETSMSKGETITLYVPNIVTEYPDMVLEKWSEEEARSFADTYGLSLEVEYKETEDYEEGIVIYQSRTAGTRVVNGVKFKITVSVLPSVPEEIIDPEDIIDPNTEGETGNEGENETGE
ncbi:MAG: Stk1 family PASTA domain-containing Ser/Thr kinase [Bacilli bacterium]